MPGPSNGEPTRAAEMQNEIDRLAMQHRVDLELIAVLHAEGAIDRDKIANLEVALITARRIGAAIGVLMTRMHLTDEQAFTVLRDASQSMHRKLRDVAEDVLLTRTIG
jgi:AmiR/NasT family two-component response regulator